jgi:hypothetical protein
VSWIGDHRVPLLALSITLVLVSIALEARKGETEVSSLAHLDDELEELEAEEEEREAEASAAQDPPGEQPEDEPRDAD